MRCSTEEITHTRDTCPVTGLRIVRRPEWLDIRLHDDYRVSFCFLGERILVTRPSGLSPHLDIDAFYRARDAVLTEHLGAPRDFVEIKDYSGIRGVPTRAQRNLQTGKFYDDVGRCLGFLPFGLRAVQEPLFRVALLLHAPVYPFALKRGYADAALTAAQLVRGFQLQQLRAGAAWVTNPRWQRREGRWAVELRVLADVLLHVRMEGDLRSEEAESWLVATQEEILAASPLGKRAPYYKVFDITALSDAGWHYGVFARIRELHRRHAAPRAVYLIGASKTAQRATSLIKPLYPHVLRNVGSLDEALRAVEIDEQATTQRMLRARSVAPDDAADGPSGGLAARARSLLRALPARLRRGPRTLGERHGIQRPTGAASRKQIEELIRSACRVMWEAPVGDDLPTVAAEHPLREVYDAFGVMQREIRQLFTSQRDRAAELALAKQQLERANRELNETLAESRRLAGAAQQAARAKGIFLASMSHEIRTPLNAVIAPLEVLKTATLPEQLAPLVALAGEGAQTLLCVIDDILDFSKLEAGKVQLEEQDFAVDELLAEACRLMAVTAREKGLALRCVCDLDAPAGWVRGDRGRLRQVLLNFVSNAIKFTESGSVELHAARASDGGGDGFLPVRFTVSDTGVGLASANVEELFEPFTQADTTPRHPVSGTGLGLAICRELVTLMGGELGALPRASGGASFWLEVPLPPAGTPRPASAQPAASVALPASAAGRAVLVVEDDASSRRMLTLLLEKAGLAVTAVADGEAACAAVDRARPDLVLMDCQLPTMDGYAATRTIRQREAQAGDGPDDARARLPIIALTAHTTREDRARCLAAGMDDYLAKPVGFGELLATLRRWLPDAPRAAS